MWSNPQGCQRDGENLFGCPAWRHGAHDPTLVTGVEHALDREGTIDAGLHSASAKDSHDLLRRKCWNWQVVLHFARLTGQPWRDGRTSSHLLAVGCSGSPARADPQPLSLGEHHIGHGTIAHRVWGRPASVAQVAHGLV